MENGKVNYTTSTGIFDGSEAASNYGRPSARRSQHLQAPEEGGRGCNLKYSQGDTPENGAERVTPAKARTVENAEDVWRRS